MDADGGGVVQLTRNGEHDEGPVFSPDGARIVFTRGADNADGDIWTISGASAATAPTPTNATGATFRKSRRRNPSSESVAAETSADCALVAIIPLLTLVARDAGTGIERRRPGLVPARLAGVIAAGFGDVKWPAG